jgi:hypothetical protein
MPDQPGGKEVSEWVVACLLCITSYIHSTKLQTQFNISSLSIYLSGAGRIFAHRIISYPTDYTYILSYVSLFIHILQWTVFLSFLTQEDPKRRRNSKS